jgi:hypothetical protein
LIEQQIIYFKKSSFQRISTSAESKRKKEAKKKIFFFSIIGTDTAGAEIQQVTLTNCDPHQTDRCLFETGSKTTSQVFLFSVIEEAA